MHRTRWTPVAATLLLAALAGTPAPAAEIEERFDRSYDLAPGGLVSVDNVNGAVVVTGWEGSRVRVEAVKKVRAGSRSRAREAMKRMEIRVDHRPDRLEVETRHPSGSDGFLAWLFGNHVQSQVDYALSVPRGARVEVDTVNGKVEVRRVEGPLEVGTTNGGVAVSDARGPVDASTTNGAIRVEITDLSEDRRMRLSTTNGGIRLVLPRDARVTVDASTTNGGIDLENLPADVRSRGRRHLRAEVGGGGPEIRLTTTNGGIKIAGR